MLITNYKHTNGVNPQAQQTTTLTGLFITPAQVLQFAQANKLQLPTGVTPAQIAGITKTVLYITSATVGAYYRGYHAMASNLSGGNRFCSVLAKTTFTVGKGKGKAGANHWVKKGQTAPTRNTGYFTGIQPNNKHKHLLVATAKTCAVNLTRAGANNNVLVVPRLTKGCNTLATAKALAPLVALMPPAYMLPACGTWQ